MRDILSVYFKFERGGALDYYIKMQKYTNILGVELILMQKLAFKFLKLSTQSMNSQNNYQILGQKTKAGSLNLSKIEIKIKLENSHVKGTFCGIDPIFKHCPIK